MVQEGTVGGGSFNPSSSKRRAIMSNHAQQYLQNAGKRPKKPTTIGGSVLRWTSVSTQKPLKKEGR
jgi:hypothetical protein